ncbi:Ty1/Copia family ribonuclease HI, partial [Vibrio vulnificus]|nr:Ty1/Copia family ribonuclease HI [Vibrio vulnificus]
HFIKASFISWSSKRRVSVAISTAESEYVAAGSACAQVLWIKHQLIDYGFNVKNVPIYCDNTSAISLSKNPILHSRTKHIEIRHHFLRDHCLKQDICLKFVSTQDQLADILTKQLKDDTYNDIKMRLGMCDLNDL